MVSRYYDNGRLSQQTMDAYNRYGFDPRNTIERLDFYLTYLEDVVPYEVGVHLVPNHLQPFDLGGSLTPRKEIQLRYKEGIFMTNIVALGTQSTKTEEIAATLAYSQWSQGNYIRYHHQAWGAFTGLQKIRFCSSRDGVNWDPTAEFHPIYQAQEVAEYFRLEYTNIRRR